MGARSLYWRSLSVGAAAWSVPYCQYKEVCLPTRSNAKQANELSTTTDPRSCARAVYIAGDTLRHQPMGAAHDGAPVMWAYGIPCPAMVSPNAGLAQRGQAVVPGWSPYMVLKSGFRPAHFLCPGGIYSWWHSASSANGSRSHEGAPVMWAYGIPCPAMVSPNAGLAQWGQAVVPGWSPYMVLESGFRPAQDQQLSKLLTFEWGSHRVFCSPDLFMKSQNEGILFHCFIIFFSFSQIKLQVEGCISSPSACSSSEL